MDFNDVDSKPNEVIELKRGSNKQILLKDQIKFKSVTCLYIFVEENYGAETTIIDSISFFGKQIDKIIVL
jgi:hypothetical protein